MGTRCHAQGMLIKICPHIILIEVGMACIYATIRHTSWQEPRGGTVSCSREAIAMLEPRERGGGWLWRHCVCSQQTTSVLVVEGMAEEAPIWLHAVSVVVVAEFHNPSILNKDFLVAEEIVPNDWDVADAISTPAVSVVNYENKISWTVDQQRLQVAKEYDLPFQEYTDTDIQDRAALYAEKLPRVSYVSLGINCKVSIIRENPLQWLKERFLKPGSWDKRLYIMPRFTINLDDKSRLNLNVASGQSSQGKSDQRSSVIVDCNLHYGGPFESVSQIRSIMSQWPNSKKNISAVLNDILGGR